jgi:putative ABC transport system permease protein
MSFLDTLPLKRIWTQRGLVIFLVLGLMSAVSLAVAVAVYADGVNYKLLNTALSRSTQQSRHSPFTFIFRYIGSWHGSVSLDRYIPIDFYLREQAAGEIGLRPQKVTRYISSDNLQLHYLGDALHPNQRIDLVKLATISHVFDHIQLVEGTLPAISTGGAENPSGSEVVEVLISLKLANELGLQVSQTYQLYIPAPGGHSPYHQEVRVSGIWQPADPSSEFWFYPPETFEKRLLVPEETFLGSIAEKMHLPVHEAVWRLALDGSSVRGESVNGILTRSNRVQNRVSSLLPNTNLEVSPLRALQQYQQQALALTGILFIFTAPVLGLVLYFLGLAANMLVRYQRNELAVLRSRGASRLRIIIIYLMEWSLLAGVGLAAGTWLGLLLAGWVSRTQSFLDFSMASNLTLRLTNQSIALGLVASLLAIALCLIPAWNAGRSTIVSYKQEQARTTRPPFWMRTYLDFLILLPAFYGLYTLHQADRLGSWRILGRTLDRGNPFENPLLFLLPTIFMLGGSLLLLRLIPFFFTALTWISVNMTSAAPILALRHLSRSATTHMGPMLLLIFTLSLAGFSASMASTFDQQLEDSVYYEIGADLRLTESSEFVGMVADSPSTNGQPSTVGQSAVDQQIWNFLPISDHLSLPGVTAATRVGRYPAELQTSGRRFSGRILGVDRADFPSVSYFRRDFAGDALIGLMNRLAADPTGLLVDAHTWSQLNLDPGDPVNMQVTVSGETRLLNFRIAGVFDYFPTYYPQEGALFVGNLDHIFASFGGVMPHDVWLKTALDTQTEDIIRGLQEKRVAVIRVQDTRDILDQVYSSPNRQGVLGLLSIGFLSAAILTTTGFLLYNLFSFRERYVILGMLRAIGLSTRQMAASLMLEQILLVLSGLAAGILVATLTSHLFIPYMPVSGGRFPGIPPYLVEVAWVEILQVSLIFSAILITGMIISIFFIRRMKIFQAIKLGEIV